MLRFFESLVDPYASYDRDATPPDRLWPFLASFLRPARWVFLWALVSVILVSLGEIFLIWYAGRLIDLLTAAGPARAWSDHGVEFLLVIGALLIVKPAIQAVNALLLNQSLMPNVDTLVRWRTHRHVLRQPVGWFQNDFAGRIANRLMQTAPAVTDVVFQTIDALAYASIYLIGAIWLLAGTDPRLALPLVIWTALYLALILRMIPRVERASSAFSDARSTLSGRIVDAYGNIQTVKLFAHAGSEEAYGDEAIEASRVAFAGQMREMTKLDIGLSVLNGVLVVSVVGYAAWLWGLEVASLGAVAAATALTLRLTSMTYWIMFVLSGLFREIGVVREGMRTIAQPIALADAPDAAELHVTGGGIVFDEVSHHYGRGAGGLDRVSLTIRSGERVGLVGRSGAGKSTLVNLALRFFDPEGGRVLIDGQDTRHVTQESLRRQIGMVTQDPSLLHRSVRANILYGRPEASEDEMIAAARRAEAHDFIMGLRDGEGREGYDAVVGERGVKLSGGQRQRIALARVILKDAPILILDEATSALDSEVEAAIQETLYGVMEGKTVIAIAHRLSTIARLDRIVVLDQGRVAEEGSHAELRGRGGLYATFWNRQSGGFLNLEAAE